VAIVKKYNIAGSEVGEVAIEDHLVASDANKQMIKDYLVALRANARQWSANTQSRPEVNHSGKKPHPQKGTGRARQGYLGAPQYKGGGRVHAPRPKFDQHVKVNKKERRAAIASLLSEKIQENRLHVLAFEAFDAPKTKKIAAFLRGLNLTGKRVLFVGENFLKEGSKVGAPSEKYEVFLKSIHNIPKIDFMFMPNVSGYDLAITQDIIVMDAAVDQLKMLLGAKS
jgi:large subunit ribosomal protein L4